MRIWLVWWTEIKTLRGAFSRNRTFLWFVLCLIGLTTRKDLAGVTSIIRAVGIRPIAYDRLLDCFHSTAIDVNKLAVLWAKLIIRCCSCFLMKVNGRIVILADGIKAPKEGRKMPSVKKLHQVSDSNTKPMYIYGHSCQALAIVAGNLRTFFAIPLVSRIHEGLVFSNRDTKTLLDKMIKLFYSLSIETKCYFVADAYYASCVIVENLLAGHHHLVTRVRNNAVAYSEPKKQKVKRRGRKNIYGEKIKIKSLFNELTKFINISSPVYGEKNVTLKYRLVNLLWRPVGIYVNFILVIHPTRGKIILMTTDINLKAHDVIKLYGIRFKIELSFKQAINTLGAYAYHFWMRDMKKFNRKSGNQYLHKKTEDYRKQTKRKMHAYHVYMMAGIISQGMLQYLSIAFHKLVWDSFGSWLRTIRPETLPSEQVTMWSMRSSLPEFIADKNEKNTIAKFIIDMIDRDRQEGLAMVA